MLLSDQLTPKRELSRIAKELKAGRPVTHDPARVAGLVEQLRTQKISVSAGPPAVVAAAWLPWVLAALLGAVVVFWLLWPRVQE
jgi:hypothetical protein